MLARCATPRLRDAVATLLEGGSHESAMGGYAAIVALGQRDSTRCAALVETAHVHGHQGGYALRPAITAAAVSGCAVGTIAVLVDSVIATRHFDNNAYDGWMADGAKAMAATLPPDTVLAILERHRQRDWYYPADAPFHAHLGMQPSIAADSTATFRMVERILTPQSGVNSDIPSAAFAEYAKGASAWFDTALARVELGDPTGWGGAGTPDRAVTERNENFVALAIHRPALWPKMATLLQAATRACDANPDNGMSTGTAGSLVRRVWELERPWRSPELSAWISATLRSRNPNCSGLQTLAAEFRKRQAI